MNFRVRLILLGSLDALIITAAVFMAYLLRFEFHVPAPHLGMIPYVILVHIIVNLLFLSWAKMYRRVWQYASVGN